MLLLLSNQQGMGGIDPTKKGGRSILKYFVLWLAATVSTVGGWLHGSISS